VNRYGGMELISVALALTGMQWYLLFNLLAGVQRVPLDLRESLRSLGLTRGEIHRQLVIPACMPSLVTGSVVAWGGTWNALILSEYVVYRGREYQVLGLGQQARHDAAYPRFPLRQLPHLPFAQGKQRRLCEREEEARPRKDQNHHHRYEWPGRHALSMNPKPPEGKTQILPWSPMRFSGLDRTTTQATMVELGAGDKSCSRLQ